MKNTISDNLSTKLSIESLSDMVRPLKWSTFSKISFGIKGIKGLS